MTTTVQTSRQDSAPPGSSPQPVSEQADDEIVLWGPVSVEAVSSDDKLITMDAIEAALPQLLKRSSISVLHKDQIVGDVLQTASIDPGDAPSTTARRLVEHLNAEHDGLPTGVFPVTEAIAGAFPHLEDRVGEDAFFAAARIYGDNETARQVQRDALGGELDAFSLSGAPVEQDAVRHCDEDGCRRVMRIEEMDLSAITLGSRTDASRSPFAARIRNPGAAFRVVQQAGYCPQGEACCAECAEDHPMDVVFVGQVGEHPGGGLGDRVRDCVDSVMDENGHDRSSAIAICRDQLGMSTHPDDEDDEEGEGSGMEAGVNMALVATRDGDTFLEAQDAECMARFQDDDGTFQDGFEGCVDAMLSCRDDVDDMESARALCAEIGRRAGKIA